MRLKCGGMRRKSANKISRKVRMSNAAKSFPESSGVNWAGVEYGEKVGKRVLVSLRSDDTPTCCA